MRHCDRSLCDRHGASPGGPSILCRYQRPNPTRRDVALNSPLRWSFAALQAPHLPICDLPLNHEVAYTNRMDMQTILWSPLHAHLLIAGGLGALIGLERELAGKDPSLRTFMLISLGSCTFAIVSRMSVMGAMDGDPSRIAAQVVTGIGFIGAGAIFRGSQRISGMTTAAFMWITAAIGMAVGFEQVDLAVSATVISIVLTWLLKLVHRIIGYFRGRASTGDARD